MKTRYLNVPNTGSRGFSSPSNRISRIGLGLVLALVATSPIFAQSRAERIESYLQRFHETGLFNGSALVIDAGKVVFEGAFGLADFGVSVHPDEGSEPEIVEEAAPGDLPANTASTRFRIASITKQFTAALVLRLAEEGLLHVDDPISLHIPEYPGPNADRITIHHLLNHTSGIPSYTNLEGYMEEDTMTPLSPEEIIALTWDEPLEFEPGTEFAYNNSGYVLLGWIVEKITETSFGEALHEWILAPLELSDTGYDQSVLPDPEQGHARGHTRTLTGHRPSQLIDPTLPHAAGMLYSTANDLARWASALFGWGGLVGPFQDENTIHQMMTPDLEDYAYGVRVSHLDIGRESGVRVVEHGGGIFGFSSYLRVFPHHERLLVVLDNTTGDVRPLVAGLTNLLWGVQPTEPRQSVARRLLPIVESGGAEPALARYFTWRRTRPEAYDYSPGEVVRLAAHFRAEQPEVALAILEGFSEEEPHSLPVVFALSDLLAAQGDTAAAAGHVETALTTTPGTTSLLTRLRALGVTPDPVLTLPTVAVDSASLMILVGEYRLNPGTGLTVTREGASLLVGQNDGTPLPLLPQGPRHFLMRGTRTQFEFVLREGLPDAVIVVEDGRSAVFSRVGPPLK